MDLKITKENWLSILNDEDTVTNDMIRCLLSANDMEFFTFEELSDKYGFSTNYYKDNLILLGKTLIENGDVEVRAFDNGEHDGMAAISEEFNLGYKLIPELSEALKEYTFDGQLYQFDDEPHNYWWVNANPKVWSYSNISNGECELFTKLKENGKAKKIAKNYDEIQISDLIIGYETNPVKQVVSLGKVDAVTPEGFYYKKVEHLQNAIDYKELKECQELQESEFFKNPNGTLFKLSKEEYEFIVEKVREINPKDETATEKYDDKQFLDEVYMSQEEYDEVKNLLLNKKNIILQGAPGVGKTFSATRLAYAIMGLKDVNKIAKVQFHQNYSYEDFVMGYKPVENGYELKTGIFYDFCIKAANDSNNNYFFIIDEINRGNLSKIFGELLMLIENDYRGPKNKIILAYSGKPFYVPENLYIIGMMNTADRSLAMIDYALRRRFSFFEMKPGFDSDGFVKYQQSFNNDKFNSLINKIKELNDAIRKDKSLGSGFEIGHSYVCGRKDVDDAWLKAVVKYDLVPTLKEYWFDDDSKWQEWEKELLASIK